MAAEFTEAEKVVKIAKPADLIEFDRGVYKHWAIYVGDEDIVNFGSDSVDSLATQKSSHVKREKLTKVADTSKCRVNNRLDDKYEARDPDLVVRDALQMVDQEVPYSVATWNCEHFVTGLRYYKPESGQVKEKVTITGIVVGTIVAFGAGLLGVVIGSKVLSNETEKKEEQEEKV